MLTYQVKINVHPSIEAAWLQWMKTEHVPDVIATGCICSFQILKSDSEPQTYRFHYHFRNTEEYMRYQKDFAPDLKVHPRKKFSNQFVAKREIFQWI